MKKNRLLGLFLLCVTSFFAQVKGKVVDENNQPIPYVNIWVENENVSTTSDIDGHFTLNIKEEKTLLFSSLGFEKKKLKSTEVSIVQLLPTTYELGEVVVLNKKETKKIEIGQSENSIHQAFENGPKFDAKYYPYKIAYKKTRYLKKVSIFTENALEEASVKIHFYAINSEGLPGEELLKKDFIVTVKKGSRRTWFDVSNLNLSFPKEGLFVAIERLFIDKNKFEKTVTTTEPNKTKIQRTYYPLPFYSFVEGSYTYTFLGGKWTKEAKRDSNGNVVKTRIFEPAIHLILTN
ncbi:MAG: carboxypeptidase-like regulatory domain-containing protein [Bacteroidota bacterium]